MTNNSLFPCLLVAFLCGCASTEPPPIAMSLQKLDAGNRHAVFKRPNYALWCRIRLLNIPGTRQTFAQIKSTWFQSISCCRFQTIPPRRSGTITTAVHGGMSQCRSEFLLKTSNMTFRGRMAHGIGIFRWWKQLTPEKRSSGRFLSTRDCGIIYHPGCDGREEWFKSSSTATSSMTSNVGRRFRTIRLHHHGCMLSQRIFRPCNGHLFISASMRSRFL